MKRIVFSGVIIYFLFYFANLAIAQRGYLPSSSSCNGTVKKVIPISKNLLLHSNSEEDLLINLLDTLKLPHPCVQKNCSAGNSNESCVIKSIKHFRGIRGARIVQLKNGQYMLRARAGSKAIYSVNCGCDCTLDISACNDNNECTIDLVKNCTCVNEPVDCDDHDICTLDYCVSGNCQHDLLRCRLWAGDTNRDGVVNMDDMLPIGHLFGSTGPARPNAHTNYTPQITGPNWGTNFSNTNIDAKYVDCDGNGVIDLADFNVILQNYNDFSYPIGLAGNGGTTATSNNGLQINMRYSHNVGNLLFYDVDVSDPNAANSPVDLYFLRLQVTYQIDSIAAEAFFTNSSFGTQDVDMKGMYYNHVLQEILDVGITSINPSGGDVSVSQRTCTIGCVIAVEPIMISTTSANNLRSSSNFQFTPVIPEISNPRVITYNGNSLSVTVETDTIWVLENPYCTPTRTSAGVSQEYIEKIVIANVDHSSGDDNNWGLFSSDANKHIELGIGQNHSFKIVPGFVEAPQDQFYSIYIDFDQSGSFEASELVYESKEGSQTALKANLTIPNNIEPTQTLMRVMMHRGTPVTDACQVFSEGEVEDYWVKITNGSNKFEAISSTNSIKISPNPSPSHQFTIDWTNMLDAQQQATIQVYNTNGQLVYSQVLTSDTSKQRTQIQLQQLDLPSGTYFLQWQSATLNVVEKIILF